MLCVRDERADVACGGMAEIHHDVCVDVGNLSVSDAKSLEPALIDQSPSANALDLLEDRAGARVDLEPWVTRTSPAQVLLHDTMHRCGIAGGEAKGDRERDFASVVKDARVVAETHVRVIGEVAHAALVEQLGRLEDLVDEHRPFAVRGRRQKMEILPDSTADGARNADVVLQARPSASNRLGDEVAHDNAALAPHAAIFMEANVPSDISDHEAAKSAIANEDVGAEPEHEKRYAAFARTGHGVCQIIGRRGIV